MEFDVTLIGNGAVASALALRFAVSHPELRIALVGPAQRSGSASLAAGAMLNVFAELEAGALELPLARRRFEAAVAATALWPAHHEQLNARLRTTPPLALSLGTHVIASPLGGPAASASDERNLDAIAAYLAEYGQRFREVDPRAIVGLHPTARARPTRALYLEDEGWLSAHHLHRAYDEALAAAPRLTRFDDVAAALAPSGDPARPTTTVQLRGGAALATRHVVLAAGASTQLLVDQLGLQAKIPRLVHGAGVSLILRAVDAAGARLVTPETVVRTPRRGLASGLYVVPYDHGYCYLGATSELRPTAAAAPSVRAVHALLQGAMELVSPALAGAQLHKVLAGSRPTTLDGYPLFGQTSIAGVWLASGTKRDGFHLSPKIAEELVAALSAVDAGHRDAQPFDGRFVPERPLLLAAGKQAAIERTVALLAAAASPDPTLHDRDASGAENATADLELLRAHVEGAYARAGLGDLDLAIPPELLDLYRDGHADANLSSLLALRAAPR
jgi:glycine oxidase